MNNAIHDDGLPPIVHGIDIPDNVPVPEDLDVCPDCGKNFDLCECYAEEMSAHEIRELEKIKEEIRKEFRKEYEENLQKERAAIESWKKTWKEQQSAGTSEPEKPKRELPPIRTIRDLMKNPPKDRDEVIKGVLRKSSKMAIAGASKARKTWQLINLAICATSGEKWLDRFEIVPTKVIYINLELHEDTFWKRLGTICDAMQVSKEIIADNMSSWCLRGYAAGYSDILPAITEKICKEGYGLIIFDPTYKILGDLDENRAGDITKLMNALEDVCFKTGAALIMVNHYGKGNQGGAETGDRTRGSSVFLSDPDAMMEFVDHKESDNTKDVLVCQTVLREFPPIEPFSVKWDGHALFHLSDHDPKKVKKKGGGESKYSGDDLEKILKGKNLTSDEWRDLTEKATGMSKSTFYRLVSKLVNSGRVFFSKLDETYSVNGSVLDDDTSETFK